LKGTYGRKAVNFKRKEGKGKKRMVNNKKGIDD